MEEVKRAMKGESRTGWDVLGKHRMDRTMSVSHRLPSGDAGDLHLQARAPFVTKINTRLTQDLEMPQRRLGRS